MKKKIGSDGLILLGVIVGLMGCERDLGNATVVSETNEDPVESTDYDWLPERLKHTMDHLTHLYPDRYFSFYYYFATDDINRNFYMTDPGLQVITEMPVTDEHALRRIEDQWYDVQARRRGVYVAKVWWRDAQKDGQSVRSTMRVTFDISTLKK